MYYVQNYYTEEIVDVFGNFEKALELAQKTKDCEIVDENDNYFYCNVELPF